MTSNGSHDHLPKLADEIASALGDPAARELLDVLTRPEADRASLIGRLVQRDDMATLADALIELEIDELARLEMIAALEQRFS